VSAKFNQVISSPAKRELLNGVEKKHLNMSIAPTSKWEEKFNVFKIEMEGGW